MVITNEEINNMMVITNEEINNMDDFLKVIGGLVVIVSFILYMLAVIFSPFGVVWLVLNH
tara:strand:- start:10623 stop:10802 length:180 start_codon:yes stop_codon:yes gene_type:complete